MGGKQQPPPISAEQKGRAVCNLHSAHLGERGRRRNHYLPPETCASHVAASVGFHIKMDPLLLQHPHLPSAPTSHHCLLPPSCTEGVFFIFIFSGDWNGREAGDGDQEKQRGGTGRTGWLSPSRVKTLKVERELCCDRMIPEAAPSHSPLRRRQTH